MSELAESPKVGTTLSGYIDLHPPIEKHIAVRLSPKVHSRGPQKKIPIPHRFDVYIPVASLTPRLISSLMARSEETSLACSLDVQFDQGKQSQGEEEINELVKFGVRGNSHRLI